MLRGHGDFLETATPQEMSSEMMGQGKKMLLTALAASFATSVAILQGRGILPHTPLETDSIFAGVLASAGKAGYHGIRWMETQYALDGRLDETPPDPTPQDEWQYPYEAL